MFVFFLWETLAEFWGQNLHDKNILQFYLKVLVVNTTNA